MSEPTYPQVQGRTAAEARVIAEADRARFNLVAEAWNDLTDDQQDSLIVIAQSMVAGNE